MKRGIAQSPEGRQLFARMTVLENLEMGAFQRDDKEGIAADLERIYELFPRLAERRSQKAGTLSGGEQQMCAIGRALLARPRLLLLDEPSMGLAPVLVERIFEVIVDINNQGTTVLLVEQNAAMALEIAHYGYVLETGKIALADTRGGAARERARPRLVPRRGVTLGQRGRRFAAAPAVTWKRVRARPGRTLLVSVGVAVAVGFLIGAAGGSTVSEELALRHALAALPPAERVAARHLVGPGGDRRLRGPRPHRPAPARPLTGEPVDAAVELADVRLGHGLVKLGAADSLAGVVHVTSGRLPTGCTPARCEVVELAGAPAPADRRRRRPPRRRRPGDAQLARPVRRGRAPDAARRRRPAARGGAADEGRARPRRPRAARALQPQLLLERARSRRPPSTAGASTRCCATEGRVQQRLTVASPLYSLTTPDDALTAAKSQSETASRRVLLVGSSAALLLLAFAGITAGALRRDAQAELRRLTMRGATRRQQASFVLGEAVAAVIPGALAGLAVGAVAVALIAHRAGVPVGAALGHGLLTPTAVALAAGGTLGAIVAVVFALRAVDGRRPRGVRPVDMAAVGAVVALALLLIRGAGLGRLARQRPRDRARRHAAPRRLRLLRPARAAARARASGRAPRAPAPAPPPC